MIQTMNPYSTTAKTAEIMSRYRPIAPKPETPTTKVDGDGVDGENSSMSQKIRQSPYLRNVWPHLQARPTRTRKRGRTSIGPNMVKRHRSSNLQTLSFQGFTNFPHQFSSNLVTLPLLPNPKTPPISTGLDLNQEILETHDFLKKLQEPKCTNGVISPQPVRPVGSSISVGCICESGSGSGFAAGPAKKRSEVEEEVESEELPAVVSDSNNKVRMANSAYKEMVGQPECSWLESIGGRRICGEVMLRFAEPPPPANGFSCWVRIEWGNGGKKRSISAYSDVMRLSCESKDYLFAWRFHTKGSSSSSSRSSPKT